MPADTWLHLWPEHLSLIWTNASFCSCNIHLFIVLMKTTSCFPFLLQVAPANCGNVLPCLFLENKFLLRPGISLVHLSIFHSFHQQCYLISAMICQVTRRNFLLIKNFSTTLRPQNEEARRCPVFKTQENIRRLYSEDVNNTLETNTLSVYYWL